jgi:hypothetical protein
MSEAKFSDELSVLFAAAEAGRADVLKSILDVIDKNEPFSGAGRLRKAALTQVQTTDPNLHSLQDLLTPNTTQESV